MSLLFKNSTRSCVHWIALPPLQGHLKTCSLLICDSVGPCSSACNCNCCHLVCIWDLSALEMMQSAGFMQGHIIHIDFGFMLSNSPGGVNFERAPFKLTAEYMAILLSDTLGSPSPCLQYFKVSCSYSGLTPFHNYNVKPEPSLLYMTTQPNQNNAIQLPLQLQVSARVSQERFVAALSPHHIGCMQQVRVGSCLDTSHHYRWVQGAKKHMCIDGN